MLNGSIAGNVLEALRAEAEDEEGRFVDVTENSDVAAVLGATLKSTMRRFYPRP